MRINVIREEASRKSYIFRWWRRRHWRRCPMKLTYVITVWLQRQHKHHVTSYTSQTSHALHSLLTTAAYTLLTLVFNQPTAHSAITIKKLNKKVPCFNQGGQSMPPRKPKLQYGPTSHPRKFPATTGHWTVTAGIASKSSRPLGTSWTEDN